MSDIAQAGVSPILPSRVVHPEDRFPTLNGWVWDTKHDATEFANRMRVPSSHVDVIQHVYVCADLRLWMSDGEVRAKGNKEEANPTSLMGPPLTNSASESMKDQINNYVGRQIGSYVRKAVEIHPRLKPQQDEMKERLIREAYDRDVLAKNPDDPRVGKLLAAGVDPKAWRAEDDKLLWWPEPSERFKHDFAVSDVDWRRRNEPPARVTGY